MKTTFKSVMITSWPGHPPHEALRKERGYSRWLGKRSTHRID